MIRKAMILKMTLDYLQSHPLVACIASVYSTTMALVKPDDLLLMVSAWGGAIVVILTIVAKCLEIREKWRNRSK